MLTIDLTGIPARLRLGTSSFSSADWCGTFYPRGTKPGDYLRRYAEQLTTVEIDATFYASPATSMVRGWGAKVPAGFRIASKVPRAITHDAYLVDCAPMFQEHIATMALLGDKLGPVLFQFPYVSKKRDPEEWATGRDFRRRLGAFLPLLPADVQYVVEVRNAEWVAEPLVDLLRSHGVALALTDYWTMPAPAVIEHRVPTMTADFAYVRFLGDHRKMDRLVADAMRKGGRVGEWDSLLVDRSHEMALAIPVIQKALDRGADVFVYFNNHYAGFAPGSIDLFAKLWREQAGTPEPEPPQKPGQLSLDLDS